VLFAAGELHFILFPYVGAIYFLTLPGLKFLARAACSFS
jgi:hypothetical protein